MSNDLAENVIFFSVEGDRIVATPVLSIPCNTDNLQTADWLLNCDTTTVEDVKNDCLTFTHQLPREYDKVQGDDLGRVTLVLLDL